MKRYNPKVIEPKWQKAWQESKIYVADLSSEKPKYVGFGMFNYPSGAGIHVGHVRNYTIPDVVTRLKRQQGFETYQPVGWDSFGLPAENFAIKTGVSPQESTKKAIEKYRKQYKAMGWAVDWSKEIDTADPGYYKWTQWVFIKLFENGLAYQKESAQWWCPHDKTVLADEQVENGRCWRCGHGVERKNLKQWFFKITDYADEILDATDDLNWTESVKASQKGWIGRKNGIDITYKVHNSKSQQEIICFTTRPDTNFGATFIVLAPEHPLVQRAMNQEIVPTNGPSRWQAIERYVKKSLTKNELERKEGHLKTGVFTGFYTINPLNDKKLPIWVSDFVLAGFGTGAVVGVPGHDMRDFEFAREFKLPIERVVVGLDGDASPIKRPEQVQEETGKMINSGELDGLDIQDAIEKMKDLMEAKSMGKRIKSYSMRDWLISRQRYWGAPIPIIHCPDCGPVTVLEKDLPVLLPSIKNYQPTGGNVSVLAGVEDWVNVACPKCGGKAKRETDTMDGYVCSSWYFLRYLSPKDDTQAWDSKLAQKWLPIDFYNGGDHATAHLLYARFFTRFFHKLGLINTPEPFTKMIYNGKVRAADGSDFSKSKGNGVDPLEIIESGYGADALRLYEMFAAPVEFNVLWDPQGVPGMHRFLSRVWTITQEFLDSKITKENTKSDDILRTAHKTIKKVTEHIEADKFNTSLAAMMEATNSYFKLKEHGIYRSRKWSFAIESLLKLLAPFAPHIAEELWEQLGNKDSIHLSQWPTWDEGLVKEELITLAVQINGKVRAEILVDADITEKAAIEAAKNDDKIAKSLTGKKIKKTIYVPGRIVNLVI